MEKDEREMFMHGVQSNLYYHNHSIEYITPKKSNMMIDGEKLLDKINQLTTKPENLSYSAKVKCKINTKHYFVELIFLIRARIDFLTF